MRGEIGMKEAGIFAIGACAGAIAYWCVRGRLARTIPRGAETPAAPVDTTNVLSRGSVAVVIGSASGIGRAVAIRCAAIGMKVVLADKEADELAALKAFILGSGIPSENVITAVCDCRNEADLLELKHTAFGAFGCVHFLMNNAACQTNGQCGPYEHSNRWKRILETNLMGVYNGCHAFVPAMIEQNCPCVVVNTGSKQGITCPPGDTAYNVSKAGVKVLTEALQCVASSPPAPLFHGAFVALTSLISRALHARW